MRRGTYRGSIEALVVLGLLLRVGVFLTASPFNPDDHYEVIRHVASTRSLPVSNALSQSYHPPLYYVLVAPLVWAERSSLIAAASLAMSMINLLIIRRLLEDRIVVRFVGPRSRRLLLLAFAATLPEFIIFSSFISNDSLSFLVGSLQFAALLAYLRAPAVRARMTLALTVALGLLTKGTFLATGPALAVIVAIVELRRVSLAIAARRTLAFCLVWLLLGSYKYVDNVARLGRPFVHNQEIADPGALRQRGLWRGPATIYDVNLVKLLGSPVVQYGVPHSYGLLLYGTFWYTHFEEISYIGPRVGYDHVGRALYIAGVLPTLAFIVGCGVAVGATAKALRRPASNAPPMLSASLLLFAGTLAVVFAAGLKFDSWACFQARLCFGAVVPMMMLFAAGLRFIGRHSRIALRAVETSSWLAVCGGVVYFVVEIGLAQGLLPPLHEPRRDPVMPDVYLSLVVPRLTPGTDSAP